MDNRGLLSMIESAFWFKDVKTDRKTDEKYYDGVAIHNAIQPEEFGAKDGWYCTADADNDGLNQERLFFMTSQIGGPYVDDIVDEYGASKKNGKC